MQILAFSLLASCVVLATITNASPVVEQRIQDVEGRQSMKNEKIDSFRPLSRTVAARSTNGESSNDRIIRVMKPEWQAARDQCKKIPECSKVLRSQSSIHDAPWGVWTEDYGTWKEAMRRYLLMPLTPGKLSDEQFLSMKYVRFSPENTNSDTPLDPFFHYVEYSGDGNMLGLTLFEDEVSRFGLALAFTDFEEILKSAMSSNNLRVGTEKIETIKWADETTRYLRMSGKVLPFVEDAGN